MTAGEYLRAHRRRLVILAAAFAVTVFWFGAGIVNPLPPRSVTMVTGAEGGAYYEFGKRYREILAREGIDLRLKTTTGSFQNLAQLSDSRSGVSVGFLQGGTTSEKNSPDLESLGTVFYEPLWFFRRSVLPGEGLDGLRGRRVSIGAEGSGTRALLLELLARHGLKQGFAELLALAPNKAGEDLIRGGIDGLFMIASWDAPLVQRLLADKDIEIASFPRAEAYVALYPYLNKVVLPAGVGDMAKRRPSADTVLIAPKASLVVRADLHPAIQYLLLDAAVQVHAGPGIFQKAGQFPAAESIDLPLSSEARNFYRSGRPFLQRHLPFWMATMITRLLVLLIPLVGVLYPLLRFLPLVLGWQMRRRINKLYGELRLIEQGLEARNAGLGTRDLTAELDRLEEKTNGLQLSMTYVSMLYMLKEHIAQVRGRLGKPKG